MALPKLLVPLFLVVGLIAAVARESVYRLGADERLVVFRLGRPADVRGPGLVILFPVVERGAKFDISDSFDARVVADYEAQVGRGRS